MIVISLARMYMTGFLEGLVVFVFAMCLFFGWLKTQHYLKYNYVILKKGHLVIKKNKMTKY